MNNDQKKYMVTVPNNIIILYCTKKKLLTIIGPLNKKSLKIALNIEVLESKKLIKITKTSFSQISNNKKKNLKALQGTTTAIIKQLITETSSILYQKLKFVGVGYKSFDVENYKNNLLLFKLGYSHLIYFKIPKELNIFCLKFTKLFISGNSYQKITQIAASIQFLKKPEPYKGKGILYENQKIKLKQGKKV